MGAAVAVVAAAAVTEAVVVADVADVVDVADVADTVAVEEIRCAAPLEDVFVNTYHLCIRYIAVFFVTAKYTFICYSDKFTIFTE